MWNFDADACEGRNPTCSVSPPIYRGIRSNYTLSSHCGPLFSRRVDRSIPTVDIEFGSARYSAWRALRAACCLPRRVDRSIPTVYVEFRSGFPLWTQHHCVFTPKTTVLWLLWLLSVCRWLDYPLMVTVGQITSDRLQLLYRSRFLLHIYCIFYPCTARIFGIILSVDLVWCMKHLRLRCADRGQTFQQCHDTTLLGVVMPTIR